MSVFVWSCSGLGGQRSAYTPVLGAGETRRYKAQTARGVRGAVGSPTPCHRRRVSGGQPSVVCTPWLVFRSSMAVKNVSVSAIYRSVISWAAAEAPIPWPPATDGGGGAMAGRRAVRSCRPKTRHVGQKKGVRTLKPSRPT